MNQPSWAHCWNQWNQARIDADPLHGLSDRAELALAVLDDVTKPHHRAVADTVLELPPFYPLVDDVIACNQILFALDDRAGDLLAAWREERRQAASC